MSRCKARKRRGKRHTYRSMLIKPVPDLIREGLQRNAADGLFVKPLAFPARKVFKHDCASLRECAPGQKPVKK